MIIRFDILNDFEGFTFQTVSHVEISREFVRLFFPSGQVESYRIGAYDKIVIDDTAEEE